MVTPPATSLQTHRGVLVVEGQDDKHTVWQLCCRDASRFCGTRSGQDMEVALTQQLTSFLITEAGSRPELISSIRNQVENSGIHSVGFLLDADDDLEECWDEVIQGFSRTGLQLPSRPHPAGTIISEQVFTPRVGIWLLPDNSSRGELEDFALKMIPPEDAVWCLSSKYIEGIPTLERKFVPAKTDKAKLYAWLATRREPGRVGAAIGAHDLAVDGALCQSFLNWLIRLFG